jgi:hypothetical protein
MAIEILLGRLAQDSLPGIRSRGIASTVDRSRSSSHQIKHVQDWSSFGEHDANDGFSFRDITKMSGPVHWAFSARDNDIGRCRIHFLLVIQLSETNPVSKHCHANLNAFDGFLPWDGDLAWVRTTLAIEQLQFSFCAHFRTDHCFPCDELKPRILLR